MKLRHLTLAAALLIAGSGFSQKNQMKTLKKIYDKQTLTGKDVNEFRSALAEAEPLMGAATAEERTYFNYYKAYAPFVELSTPEGQANSAAIMSKISSTSVKNFATAAAAVVEMEKNGKKVVSDDIKQMVASVKPLLINQAIALAGQKKYKEGSDMLYSAYQLDPSDPEMLYFAANYSLDAKDNETALRYFTTLKDMKWTGAGTAYFATSLANDQESQFPSEAEMNRFVTTLKTHTNPRKEVVPSKRPEVLNRIALILLNQGKAEEAKSIIAEARTESPNEVALMMTEADLYLKLDDMEGYKNVISKVLEKNPNDPILNFNLGVVSLNSGQLQDAEKYFLRTIELNPKYADAYVNMAVIKLKADEKLVEQMNSLGTSPAENKKYDALKVERNKLFQATLPYLEKAYEIAPENEAVVDNLMSVYNYLEMTDKYKALKAKHRQ